MKKAQSKIQKKLKRVREQQSAKRVERRTRKKERMKPTRVVKAELFV